MRNSVDSGAECMIGNECMTTRCMTSECMTSECMNTECMIGKANSLCGNLIFTITNKVTKIVYPHPKNVVGEVCEYNICKCMFRRNQLKIKKTR